MLALADNLYFIAPSWDQTRTLGHTFSEELNSMGMEWRPGSMSIYDPLRWDRQRQERPPAAADPERGSKRGRSSHDAHQGDGDCGADGGETENELFEVQVERQVLAMPICDRLEVLG